MPGPHMGCECAARERGEVLGGEIPRRSSQRDQRRFADGVMRRSLIALLLPGLFVMSASCDVCAGTPSCNNPPQISHGGQFIERRSGAPVAGVRVEFIRRGGAATAGDTVRATSNSDG